MRLSARGLLAAVLGLGGVSAAPAQAEAVVPNVYTAAEGPGSSPVPIHVRGNPWTFQMVISQAQLAPLVGQDLTAIRYRHSAVPGGSYPLQTTTWADYRIRVGPSVAPSAASGTFAANFTAAPTEVRSGPLTVAPGAWPNFGPGAPNPWGPEIGFDTPYRYTGGDLAFLITHPGSDNPNIGDALIDSTGSATPGRGTDFAYYAGQGNDAASGALSNFMPVFLVVAVTPVPEPSLGLLAGGTALAAGAARRQWRRAPATG